MAQERQAQEVTEQEDLLISLGMTLIKIRVFQ
jgi:hypothetical protein